MMFPKNWGVCRFFVADRSTGNPHREGRRKDSDERKVQDGHMSCMHIRVWYIWICIYYIIYILIYIYHTYTIIYICIYIVFFTHLFQIISQVVFLPGLNSGGSSGSTTCDKCDGKHATERLDLNRRRCPNERVKHPPIERLPKYVSSSPTIYIIIY